jgi:hypothetical protein
MLVIFNATFFEGETFNRGTYCTLYTELWPVDSIKRFQKKVEF